MVPKICIDRFDRSFIVFFSFLLLGCGGGDSSSQTSTYEAWDLGETTIVQQGLPGNDVTSMACDSTNLFFSIDGGALMQVAHTDTIVGEALPQEPYMRNRYEMKLDDQRAIYWSNGLSGAGNPGEIIKTALDTQQQLWSIGDLNGPERLQMVNGQIYFIDDLQEVMRISLSGLDRETIYSSESRNLCALAVSPEGDLFLGSYSNENDTPQSVISRIPVGGGPPIEISRPNSHRIVQILIQGNFLFVVDTHLIYSLDTLDGTIVELVNGDPLDPYAPFFVDEDGIYWVGSDNQTYAAYLDGSNLITVGEGTFFCKCGSLMYWYNRAGVLMRRTLAHH
ncbi:MAG: hypothetical protein HY911_03730 [Desulfobacterales bacterium]|nr:hypothetical protein [Desulfobacterales bacterium]